MQIESHVLRPATNLSWSGKGDLKEPEALLIHYTGGTSVDGTVSHLTEHGFSYNVIFDRDASATQLVPFNRQANHCAGSDSWEGRANPDEWTIGMALANLGHWHSPQFERMYEYQKSVHRNEESERLWEVFSKEMLDASLDASRLLFQTYPSLKLVLGHDDVAPGRKQDPGPLFPMDTFREVLLAKTPPKNNPDAGTFEAEIKRRVQDLEKRVRRLEDA